MKSIEEIETELRAEVSCILNESGAYKEFKECAKIHLDEEIPYGDQAWFDIEQAVTNILIARWSEEDY